MNMIVSASILRRASSVEKHEPALSRESALVPANDIVSQPQQDPIVALRQGYLKHMLLCRAYDDIPNLPEDTEFDPDAEADAAEN